MCLLVVLQPSLKFSPSKSLLKVAVPQASAAEAEASQSAIRTALSGSPHSSVRSLGGQVTVGGVLSEIVIVREQEAVLLFWHSSVAEKVTVCTPVVLQPSL